MAEQSPLRTAYERQAFIRHKMDIKEWPNLSETQRGQSVPLAIKFLAEYAPFRDACKDWLADEKKMQPIAKGFLQLVGFDSKGRKCHPLCVFVDDNLVVIANFDVQDSDCPQLKNGRERAFKAMKKTFKATKLISFKKSAANYDALDGLIEKHKLERAVLAWFEHNHTSFSLGLLDQIIYHFPESMHRDIRLEIMHLVFRRVAFICEDRMKMLGKFLVSLEGDHDRIIQEYVTKVDKFSVLKTDDMPEALLFEVDRSKVRSWLIEAGYRGHDSGNKPLISVEGVQGVYLPQK